MRTVWDTGTKSGWDTGTLKMQKGWDTGTPEMGMIWDTGTLKMWKKMLGRSDTKNADRLGHRDIKKCLDAGTLKL